MHSDMLMTETSDCSGEQYDSDLGLYYLRARYYNSLTGRFLSRDPDAGVTTNPKTLHKYVYVGGDPVNAIDPTGNSELTEYSAFTLSVTKRTIVVSYNIGQCLSNAFGSEAGVLGVEVTGTGTAAAAGAGKVIANNLGGCVIKTIRDYAWRQNPIPQLVGLPWWFPPGLVPNPIPKWYPPF